jgi:broad specificity phosphatase PhoE
MGWPKLLVLVRHAESEGNIRSADERAEFPVATHSIGITERGREQARITASYIKEHYPVLDARYVSYYERAKQTMSIICPDDRVYEDPRLAEAQRGIWHTMTHEQIAEQYPFEIKRKEREGYYHYRPPGGENWADVEMRVHSFLGTLSRDCEGQRVLIVVHAHWLILFQRLIHHFSISEAVRRYEEAQFKNTSVTVYRGEQVEGQSRLVLDYENVVPWEGRQ